MHGIAQEVTLFPVEGIDDDTDAHGDGQDNQAMHQPAQRGREPAPLLVLHPDRRFDRNRQKNPVTKQYTKSELHDRRLGIQVVIQRYAIADGRQHASKDSETSKDRHATEIASVHGFLHQRFSNSYEHIILTRKTKKVKLPYLMLDFFV
ncbi:MAG: hypothetical protein UT32_C0013G0002 [Parcubacteria group bacterium GW2011_GWC2_39_14]|nr:MAG: hypothetical protein UT32_C0013G0002 [Parcubacteria group bacterium GW2011_GWC2_39_14]KKR54490.1 MAG: hypothetical protein UT91_C0014G0002 [Parcubacteria group bacterium GW2011_GWA2_40_23]